ncbi:MAG TPA: hypothetical protein VN673_18620, partial [Clostridia bacterium]|nr:hypothetical protein [Clostridia bacterium]
MKSKPDGLLFVVAAVAVASALFLPVGVLEASLPLAERLKPLTSSSVLAWLLGAAAFWGFAVRFWTTDNREYGRLKNTVLLVVLQAVLLRTTYEIIWTYSPFSV